MAREDLTYYLYEREQGNRRAKQTPRCSHCPTLENYPKRGCFDVFARTNQLAVADRSPTQRYGRIPRTNSNLRQQRVGRSAQGQGESEMSMDHEKTIELLSRK